MANEIDEVLELSYLSADAAFSAFRQAMEASDFNAAKQFLDQFKTASGVLATINETKTKSITEANKVKMEENRIKLEYKKLEFEKEKLQITTEANKKTWFDWFIQIVTACIPAVASVGSIVYLSNRSYKLAVDQNKMEESGNFNKSFDKASVNHANKAWQTISKLH